MTNSNGLKIILAYLLCSDFFCLVGIGSVASKNKPEGGKEKGIESQQILLEKEILAQARGLLHLYSFKRGNGN